MSRLTLILSDLYLPEETLPEAMPPGALAMPNLEWLLRFGAPARRIADWRAWLCTECGAGELAASPVAHSCALSLSMGGAAWLATPVHLQTRLDHVRLADRGLLRLDVDARQQLREEFARSFGPAIALNDLGERAFVLTGLAAAAVRSVDPARRLDADIGASLPSGPGAGELRRLATEIEMWLHGAAINQHREAQRLRQISALWLWGGGTAAVGADHHQAPSGAAQQTWRFYGGDPFLLALAQLAPRCGLSMPAPITAAPSSFASLGQFDDTVAVEFGPMSGTRQESLAALDEHWFAPVRAALSSGRLRGLDLVANDRLFRITRPGIRFWRRSQPWLTRLRGEDGKAKA